MEFKFIQVTVDKIEQLSPLVKRFTLKMADGTDMPAFTGGAHVYVKMHDGDKDFTNAYSLCSTPEDLSYYQLAIKREENGRGGSKFMHDKVKEGDTLEISTPNNVFSLQPDTERVDEYILIGGGIGITPFLSQLPELEKSGKEYRLYYLKHDDTEDVIEDELTSGPYSEHVSVHCTERGTRLDLESLFKMFKTSYMHIYVCGDSRLQHAVEELCERFCLLEKQLHIEKFSLVEPVTHELTQEDLDQAAKRAAEAAAAAAAVAAAAVEAAEKKEGASTAELLALAQEITQTEQEAKPYTIVCVKSSVTIEALPHETVLAAIERVNGPKIECMCRVGCCGACEVKVLEGEVDYQDQFYSDDQRDNTRMLACSCSAKSDTIKLDI